jgi:hypothetical protein
MAQRRMIGFSPSGGALSLSGFYMELPVFIKDLS